MNPFENDKRTKKEKFLDLISNIIRICGERNGYSFPLSFRSITVSPLIIRP